MRLAPWSLQHTHRTPGPKPSPPAPPSHPSRAVHASQGELRGLPSWLPSGQGTVGEGTVTARTVRRAGGAGRPAVHPPKARGQLLPGDFNLAFHLTRKLDLVNVGQSSFTLQRWPAHQLALGAVQARRLEADGREKGLAVPWAGHVWVPRRARAGVCSPQPWERGRGPQICRPARRRQPLPSHGSAGYEGKLSLLGMVPLGSLCLRFSSVTVPHGVKCTG